MIDLDIHRRIGEQEIASILILAKTIERVDGHKALEDHTWVDLVQGGRKGISGLIAYRRNPRAAVGYVQISKGPESWGIELLLHPMERNKDSQTGIALLKEALKEIRRDGGGHVHMWIAKPSEYLEELAIQVGFTRGRDLFQMRCSLPLDSSPPEIVGNLRTFQLGIDEDRWLEVNNKAFAWHREQGRWVRETLLSREAEPWFDPRGFFLLEIENQLAAFVWTKVHVDEESPIGEIYVVATNPKFKGRGLGETMCKVGLNYLSSLGISTGMLYVDATNEPALKVYGRLGFHVDHVDRAYTIDITPQESEED